MQSKFEFVYEPNGNLVKMTSTGDKLYEGQVGTAEYYLRMKDEHDENNWMPTDYVFIAFEKPNKTVVNQRMKYANGMWQHVSNGWETDFDNIDTAQNIKISFICRRYSTDKTTVATKTTEQYILPVYPSECYTYLESVEGGAAEEFLSNIQSVEAEFVRFKENTILIDQAIAEVETLPFGEPATVNLKRQDEKGNTLFSFGVPQGHTIREVISGKPEITFEKTITPLTAIRTDGKELPSFEVYTRNGRDGNGVFALEIENGNLVMYSEQVDDADFVITDDGQLNIILEGGN